MRAVLDTNVAVSGHMSPRGPPDQILERWERNEFDLLVSDELLTEYARVFRYPHLARLHKLDDADIDDIIAEFRTLGILVTVTVHLTVVADDPDDDKVLECAVAGHTDVIVSGDKHLLRLGTYDGIRILSPAAFLAELDELS